MLTPAHLFTGDFPEPFLRWLAEDLNAPLRAPAFQGVVAVMQIDLLDPERPATFQLHFDGKKVALNVGKTQPPSFVLKVHREDLRALLLGASRVGAALTDGRLRVAGDLGLAVRLGKLLFPDTTSAP